MTLILTWNRVSIRTGAVQGLGRTGGGTAQGARKPSSLLCSGSEPSMASTSRGVSVCGPCHGALGGLWRRRSGLGWMAAASPRRSMLWSRWWSSCVLRLLPKVLSRRHPKRMCSTPCGGVISTRRRRGTGPIPCGPTCSRPRPKPHLASTTWPRPWGVPSTSWTHSTWKSTTALTRRRGSGSRAAAPCTTTTTRLWAPQGRRVSRRCPPLLRPSRGPTTRICVGWYFGARLGTAGWRCWWAVRRAEKPERAGKQFNCSVRAGGCGIPLIPPGPSPHWLTSRRSARAPLSG